jgi:tetratricopeptide (TPR) repeat protein
MAEADFRAAASWDANYYKAHYNLGGVHRRRGELTRAVESYGKALAINPEFAAAWKNRGNAYRDLQQFDKALADYDRAIELAPRDPDYWISRALLRLTRDLHEPQRQGIVRIDATQRAGAEAALADLRAALALDPANAGVRFQYGLLLRACGHDDAALVEFNHLLSADENAAAALAQRGLTHQMAGRAAEALADISAAIQAEPDNPVFYQLRASLLLEQGDSASAADDVQKAQQLEARTASRSGGAARAGGVE